MKTNIKKYVAIFACFVLVIFSINFTSNNTIIYAEEKNAEEKKEEKTGKNIQDATGLGTEIFTRDGTASDIETLAGSGTETEIDGRYDKFNNALYRIWGAVLVVLQIASVAGVIFVGLKYMFASSDVKADLKKNMINLVIGMIIVFGASTVVGFVTGTFTDIFKPLL